jgi:hypothetical protein
MAAAADAAGMHVLPHKPVSGDAVGEDRVDCWRLDACPYDRTGTRSDCGQRQRLACPRQRVRLEGAGEEIEQANLKLFARSGGNVVVPLGCDRRRHEDGKRGASGFGRFR